MNPSCCTSPRHMEHIPSLAHAAIAIALVLAVAWLFSLCWAWMSTPFVRHACRRCVKEACGFCQREERDRKVREYAEEARQRKAERDAG